MFQTFYFLKKAILVRDCMNKTLASDNVKHRLHINRCHLHKSSKGAANKGSQIIAIQKKYHFSKTKTREQYPQ